MLKLEEIEKAINDKLMSDAKVLGCEHPLTSYEIVDYGNLTEGMFYVKFYINGDWKHDHLYFDSVLRTLPNFYNVKRVDVEDTGSDWYGCGHMALFSELDDKTMKGFGALFI